MQTMKTTIVVITTIAHRPIDPTTIADIGAVKNTGTVELWTTEPVDNNTSCKIEDSTKQSISHQLVDQIM